MSGILDNQNSIGNGADETIVGIYHFFQPRIHEGNPPMYYLLHLLDHRGILDRETALKVYRTKVSEEVDRDHEIIGPFESLEQLNQYAFALCEEINAPRVSLLSVAEYNLLLENSHDLINLAIDIKSKGNILENIDREEKTKNGFFSKIFR